MTEVQKSLRNDVFKVFLSSAWVAIVAFGCQYYAAKQARKPETSQALQNVCEFKQTTQTLNPKLTSNHTKPDRDYRK